MSRKPRTRDYKMTRSVVSPSMVAHVWAQQEQPSATCRESGGGSWGGGSSGGGRSAYFEGAALYSYGSHYMTGFILQRRENGGAGGIALINSTRNSVTTNGRRAEAEHATRHYGAQYLIPDLQDLADLLLERVRSWRWAPADNDNGSERVDLTAAEFKAARVAVLESYLQSHALEISEESAAFLCAHFGLRAASWRRIKAEAEAKAARDKAAEVKRDISRKADNAARFADMPESEFRALWPADAFTVRQGYQGKKTDGRLRAEAFGRELGAALRAGRISKLSAKRLETLAARVKAYRAHLAGMESRATAAWKAERMAEYTAWKADPDARTVSASTFENWAPDVAADIRETSATRHAVKNALAFEAWQAGQGARPEPESFAEGTSARAAILADMAAERERLGAEYTAWKADPAAPRPAARLFLSGELNKQYPDAWGELSAAERADADAKREAEQAEAWRAWRTGESHVPPRRADGSGQAYIRRSADGERLETSQGADVPWREAVRAFRFIKLCRERGEAFRRNGRTVRVGHFQIDSITAAGDMVAGCHRFAWAEIEKLARETGAFELGASADAVESTD